MLLEVCPFCRSTSDLTTLKPGKNPFAAIPITQLCLGCYQLVEDQSHDDISRADRSFIDKLPYGTIVINEDNTVTHYNKKESRITGLDPQEIIGKNFFTEVAPCTSVREFKGRLDEMRQQDIQQQEDFKFTFNHQNFFARVHILISFDHITQNAVISVRVISEEDDDGSSIIDIDEF